MPYTITHDENRGGVIATYSGAVTPEEIFNSLVERFDDTERGAALNYSIGDFTNASGLSLSASNVRELAARAQNVLRRQENLTVAIVAPSDIAFGIGRMIQMYSSRNEGIAVFRTLTEAQAWISERLAER